MEYEPLAEVLTRLGIVDRAALDDPEGYDRGVTKQQIAEAANQLSLPPDDRQKLDIQAMINAALAAMNLVTHLIDLLTDRKEQHEMTPEQEAEFDTRVRRRQAGAHWQVSAGGEEPAGD